jgi:succinate dehydrogenase / fumarate reductase flavoprotein subunit
VYLNVSFLKESEINRRIPEVRDLCNKYIGLDIAAEPIPVAPSVHFFMGGIAVNNDHETNIRNLFAVGECASMYHGANRLGGNSLLAAIYSGMVAAREIAGRDAVSSKPDFSKVEKDANDSLAEMRNTKSVFPVMYIRDMASETMNKSMGIIRDEASTKEGITDIDYYLSVAEKLSYDNSVLPYFNYSLSGILTLARAALTCAEARKDSRGAHFRSDFPDTLDDYSSATIITFNDGRYDTRLDKEDAYES